MVSILKSEIKATQTALKQDNKENNDQKLE